VIIVEGTEESLDLFDGHVMEWVLFNIHGLPGGCSLFDLFNDVFIDWVEVGVGEGDN